MTYFEVWMEKRPDAYENGGLNIENCKLKRQKQIKKVKFWKWKEKSVVLYLFGLKNGNWSQIIKMLPFYKTVYYSWPPRINS